MNALVRPQSPRLLDLQSSLQWSHDRTFSGHVYDAADLGRRFVVELLIDGLPVQCMRAGDYIGALAAQGIGDGCYGFSFALAEGVLDCPAVVEARIANLGTTIGRPILIPGSHAVPDNAAAAGAVRWLGGLRFAGWLDDDEMALDVFVDGELIDQISPSGWSHTGGIEDARAVRAFDLNLPERFADGSARRLGVILPNGLHLDGSPMPFLAFADAAQAKGQIADTLRADLLDQLIPNSIPFSRYRNWLARLPNQPVAPAALDAVVIVIGSDDFDGTLGSLKQQSHRRWVAASLPQTSGFGAFDPGMAKAFLAQDGAAAAFVAFVPSGTLLKPDALARLAATFAERPDTVAIYGDLELASGDGSTWPLALPAFDYERMLEQGYCGHVFALRRDAADRALSAGANSLYRAFNALLDGGMAIASDIVHLPGAIATLPAIDLPSAARVLAAATTAHLDRAGVHASVAPAAGAVLPALRVSRAADATASITIVIPTRNRRDLLEPCIASLQAATRRGRCDIMVVDNGSTDADTLAYLDSIDGRQAVVLRAPGDFNFARLNNRAAAAADTEHLCLLNNDIQALDGEWLDEMLGRLGPADVGAVGAHLIWPSGIVQHGGVVLGPNFAATHAFNDRMDGDAGYGDLLRVAHQCSAVTAACLVTRRADYLAVGGMDEYRFPVNFNDVDYCLKLRAAGKRIVFTPHARLRHFESASRGADKQPDRKARFERELRNLRAKWAEVLAADPYYSPLLSTDPIPFSALAWPQRPMTARTSAPPIATIIPPGY